jgi:hypothetical protein
MVPRTTSNRNVNRYGLFPAASSVLIRSTTRGGPQAAYLFGFPVRRLRDEDLVVEEATTAYSGDDREGDDDEQPDAIHPQSYHSVNHLLP